MLLTLSAASAKVKVTFTNERVYHMAKQRSVRQDLKAAAMDAIGHLDTGGPIMEELINLLENASPPKGLDADEVMKWDMDRRSRIKQANLWIRGT